MRKTILAAAFVLLPVAANAADITVLTPGVTNAVLKQLSAKWTAATGNKVNLVVGTVGKTIDNVGSVPADAVMLPSAAMPALAAKFASGSVTAIGSARFGLAVKAGQPHPDISTVEKFSATLKTTGQIAYMDPAIGSLSGGTVADMLKRPEFAGIAGVPVKKSPGAAVVDGDALFAGGVISEELPVAGADVAAPFPDALGFHIDFSGAVLANSAHPDDAKAFVTYITGPEAAPVWKSVGITPP